MTQEEIEECAIALQRKEAEECNLPFPYEGCRRILAETCGQYEDFGPDLNTFFCSIEAYCSYGKRLLKWSEPQIIKAREVICLPFFEKHPEYSLLQRKITERDSPDLFEDLNQYEEMRQQLFELLGHLLNQYRNE